MNRAVERVQTPYFALLNNDTEVEPDWLEPLVESLERHPEAAAVQSRIMLYDRRDLVQSAGGAKGFTIPIWDNPSELFNLFTGQPVRLIEWRLPHFKFEFTYTQKIPIFGPLFAQFGGSIGAEINIGLLPHVRIVVVGALRLDLDAFADEPIVLD